MKCMSTHNMCEVWQRLSASTTEELSWTIITDRQQWNAPRVFSAAFNRMPMQHISLAFSLACADRCPRNVSWMSSCLSGCVRRCLLCTRNQDWDEWKDLWDRQLQQRWLPPLPLWFETELLGVCVCRKEGGKSPPTSCLLATHPATVSIKAVCPSHSPSSPHTLLHTVDRWQDEKKCLWTEVEIKEVPR